MTNFVDKDIFNFRQLIFLNKYALYDNAIVAGGCFKNIFNNEPIKDIDLYFRTKGDYNEAIKRAKQLEEAGSYRFVYKNDKVVSYRDNDNKVRLEFIKTIFGEPEQIISQFDFTVTKFAFYQDDTFIDDESFLKQFRVSFHEDFFEHLQTKRLVIDNELPYPFSSFERSYKYRDKGYNLCRESKVKLLKAIREEEVLSDSDLSKSFYDGMD